MSLIDLSLYTLVRTPKSHCGNCEAELFMLTTRFEVDYSNLDQALDLKKNAWYYLCAQCGLIAKVGGPVIAQPEPHR